MTLDIAAIKARADKATAGPWDWNSRHGLGAPNRLVMWPSHEYGCDLDIEGEEADLAFIRHARTDIPALIAALEASEAETLSVCNREAETIARYDDKLAALEQERDALKERENVTDELMASQYRAGAQAGWNAAQLIWPKSQEAIARLTNVEKGDLEHIRAANARRALEASK